MVKNEKHSLYILLFLILLILQISCQNPNNSKEKIQESLSGNYFGQTPPKVSPELFAPEIISTGAHEMSITISNDLKEIFIGRSSLNWSSSIVQFTNGQDGWKEAKLASFARSLGNNYPFLSPDNKHLYFNSKRSGGDNGFVESNRGIWVSEFEENKWSAPNKVIPDIDPTITLTYPSIAKNGNIYFNATLENGLGHSDIYCVKKNKHGYGKPENLGSVINSEYYEFHPYISPNEDFLMFDAVNPDGYGSNDIYISFKDKDGEWMKAVNLGETINGEAADMRPYLSPDGKYLFFSSNRKNIQEGLETSKVDIHKFSEILNGPGNGSQDIYWVDAKIIEDIKTAHFK